MSHLLMNLSVDNDELAQTHRRTEDPLNKTSGTTT